MKNQINEWVFDMLASKCNPKSVGKFKDPAFDLNNRRILIYSSNVLSILGWNSYDPYIADMKDLLTSKERR
jgi:hypothetical protein